MKTRILLLTIAFFSALQLQAQEKLDIKTSKSELKWFGDYVFFFSGHEGTIGFKEGHFIKTDGKITGGEFIIDMHSIKNTDIENTKANNGLVEHLKDDDFFSVEKHPTAKLIITHTTYHNESRLDVYANLTIKGITLPIKFQAEVDFKKKQMTTKFKIDRMRWNIKYTGDGRDNAISDAIGFHATLSL